MHRTAQAGTALLAVTALALTGCAAGADPSPTPTQDEAAPGYLAVADEGFDGGGEVVVQVDYDTAEASGLDPQGAATARSWMLEGLSYETLTTIDEDLAVAPSLATSWEMPSDTEYVFALADDAVFSNGRPMTAEDVAGSLQRLIDVPTTWTGQLGQVSSIEVTGDLEVTVTLAEPSPFLAALANTPAAVLPIAEIEAGEVDITTEMLGTGPLVATAHRQDEEWTFEPNEHHPDADALGFSALSIDIVGDEATRAAALRDGSADFAVLNSSDSAELLSNADDVTVVGQRHRLPLPDDQRAHRRRSAAGRSGAISRSTARSTGLPSTSWPSADPPRHPPSPLPGSRTPASPQICHRRPATSRRRRLSSMRSEDSNSSWPCTPTSRSSRRSHR